MENRTFQRLIILFEKKNEELLRRNFDAGLHRLQAELAKHQIHAVWDFVREEDFTQQLRRTLTEPEYTAESKYPADNRFCFSKNSLYLTDSRQMQEVLQLWGFYAAALVHEGNRETSFPHAHYLCEGLSGLDYVYLKQVYERLAGLPWDILETEHLKVRESTVEDVTEFYRIYREPSITRYMDELFQEPDMERAYMRNYIRQIYGLYGYGLWTVLLKETGQVIGRAGISVREGYELPELGFVIEAAQQRKGYAMEVCSAILHYAREELRMEGVQALVCAGNEASLKLLQKLGFSEHGEVEESGKIYRQWIKKF